MMIIEGEYDVIVADPPWRYGKASTPNREARRHYDDMSTDEIKALEIPSAKKSILYLWVTAPMLPEGLEVMKAWGFKYKSQYVWDKLLVGIGHWARGQHENLLVGTKGKWPTPPPAVRWASVIKEQRREHSRKPESVYEMIEEYYPGKRYLETFARYRRTGWTTWGNEVKEAPKK